MNYAKLFDNISGKFFFAGLLTAKLRALPIPLITAALGLFSALSYLIGYVLWLVACHFHPERQAKENAWYGFAQINNQHRIAAAIGFVGISLSLAAIVFPGLLLPGMWLFAVSNTIWSIAEYHKLENPPQQDKIYSAHRQHYYFNYAILATLVSVISAAALTTSIIFPPLALGVFIVSALLTFSFTVAAYYFLLSDPTPKKKLQEVMSTSSSHAQMAAQMTAQNTATLSVSPSLDKSSLPTHTTLTKRPTRIDEAILDKIPAIPVAPLETNVASPSPF